MYTDLLLKSTAFAAAAMALACSCDGTGSDVPEPETPDMERPVEMVTDAYTAYPSGVNACVDSYLTIDFESAPELGTQGSIFILDGDGRIADEIDMADVASGKPGMTSSTVFNTAMDAIGSSASGYYRIVYYDPAVVSGNTVTIRLHSGKLDYGKEYSVVIEEGAVVADGFGGISAGEWTFTVMPQPEKDGEVTVGSRDCDFMTVQGAVNFANSCGQSRDMTISVTAGIYEEQLYIRNKDNLTIRGESPESTIIRFDNCNDYINGVGSGVQSVRRLEHEAVPGRRLQPQEVGEGHDAAASVAAHHASGAVGVEILHAEIGKPCGPCLSVTAFRKGEYHQAVSPCASVCGPETASPVADSAY